MQESTTYQKILREGREVGREEGRIIELRRVLLLQGTKHLREPDAATVAALDAIRDIDRLEALAARMVDPNIRGWDDLLAGA